MSCPPSADGGSPRSRHQPVLLRETLTWLDLRPGHVVVDGTVGAGGHSAQILSRIGPNGVLIGLDRDEMMLRHAARRLTGENVHLVPSTYARLPEILADLKISSVDRVLLDLGLSSDQLADDERGFGFKAGGELDLRFDIREGQPAWKYLESVEESELVRVLNAYGEEPFSLPIAREIVKRRSFGPIQTAEALCRAVQSAIPERAQRDAKKHPATRVFQALRIVVNAELDQLKSMLETGLTTSLSAGGRAVVITFHSLEDRLVKDAFRDDVRWQNLTPKPVQGSAAEIRLNPRSRTAKLRAALRKAAPTSPMPASPPRATIGAFPPHVPEWPAKPKSDSR